MSNIPLEVRFARSRDWKCPQHDVPLVYGAVGVARCPVTGCNHFRRTTCGAFLRRIRPEGRNLYCRKPVAVETWAVPVDGGPEIYHGGRCAQHPDTARYAHSESYRIELRPVAPLSTELHETWTTLQPLLQHATGEWIAAKAWAVGGGDPEGCDIRIRGGKALYEAAWCNLDRDKVRLARVDPGDALGPKEVVRWVDPDTILEVRQTA